MPGKVAVISEGIANLAVEIGEKIRGQRKALGVSATITAEAAGMSRVTLYRIEKGATSVTLGACLSALTVLGLDLKILQFSAHKCDQDPTSAESIPVRIAFADYPQLKQLSWHVQGTDTLSPREALDIYDRNWRHLDLEKMEKHERRLVTNLRQVFIGESNNV